MAGNENSGRKTDAKIVQHYIDTNLANDIGNEELKRIKKVKVGVRQHQELKDLVMPIITKNMVDKKEINEKLELLGETQKIISKILNEESEAE